MATPSLARGGRPGLPLRLSSLARAESVGAIESVKAASDFYAPVSGQIKEVNAELEDAPDRVNMDAQGDGASA